ncbi:MAG TPA: FkbM family methyltransferase [Kiritimatiellae bacterium]|nr:FkbM family methyltransferase [Kiritimatiellia bacterium]
MSGSSHPLKARLRRLLPERILYALRWLRDPFLLRWLPAEKWPPWIAAARVIRPGDAVVDVGANIGFVAKIFSEMVGPTGLVVAIEPVPATYRLLVHNLKWLGIRNVVALCRAAGAERETVDMVMPTREDGHVDIYLSRVVKSGECVSRGHRLKVPAKPLDDLVAEARVDRPISLVKIDVEGSEVDVIRGARRLLETHRPALVVETSGALCEADSNLGRLHRLLVDLGYRSYRLQESALTPLPVDQSLSEDVLFLCRPPATCRGIHSSSGRG